MSARHPLFLIALLLGHACAPGADADDPAPSQASPTGPAATEAPAAASPEAELPLARPRHPPRANEVADGPASARLLVPGAALVAGDTTTLGLRLDLEPGWHVYWRGQNDTGLPVELELDLPDGWQAGPIGWPAPERYASDGFVDHVYHDAATLLLPVQVPAEAPAGPVTLGASVDWLVCEEACQAGHADLTLTVEVVAAGQRVTPREDDLALLDAARAGLPHPLPDDVSLSRSGDEFVLRVPGAARLAFLPDADGLALKDIAERNVAAGDTLRLLHEPRLPGGPNLLGLVAVWRDEATEPDHYLVDLAPPGA